MTTNARPPRGARWLLARILPSDLRDHLPDELDEIFARRCYAHGPQRARLWYWRQVPGFAFHLAKDRVRHRRVMMRTGFSWIDFKLALRMLVRYPGLTLVSVLGMAVGIAIATAAFTIGHKLLDPALPLDEGDRIVAIQNWDVQTNNREPRALHDFMTWRADVRSVEELSAFRNVSRNLIGTGAVPETIVVAEMTASGFRVARVAPAQGRYLLPEDERVGAPDVVVISDETWRRRFAGDPNVLGRHIQLGDRPHAIVGVMPPGFAFPVADHYWTPLRLSGTYEPRSGSAITVFGRLAADATLETAKSELATIGRRTSAAFPKTHEHLRPRVTPYTYAFTDMDDPDNAIVLRFTQSAVVLLLAIVCVNVAIVIYARTATRQGEMAVRTALGASRRRIVWQLFLEALVLAGVAAVVGVGLVQIALEQLEAALRQLAFPQPFWMTLGLSVDGVFAVIILALFAAAIVGIVPALKATGPRVQARLQGLSAGSGSRMQMGRLWTLLIVVQVAFAVALLPATLYGAWDALRFRDSGRDFAAAFLTAEVVLDRGSDVASTPDAERAFREAHTLQRAELERQVEAESAVAAMTFSLIGPGEEVAAVIEAEGVGNPPEATEYNIVEGSKHGHFVRFNKVALDWFDAYEVPVLTGRKLQPGDAAPGAEKVVVNRTFVDRLYGGANVLGRRFKYVGRSREAGVGNVAFDRSYEIVGVVPDFPAPAPEDRNPAPRVYHALTPRDLAVAVMAIRVRASEPSAFAPRLREIAAAVDPRLQLRGLGTAQDVMTRERGLFRVIGFTLIALLVSVVALAAAGIYALMAFTVARRRKEIGIRTALGADPTRILAGIFSRALAQLGTGAALGMIVAIGVESLSDGETLRGNGIYVLPLVALFMTAVGLLAAVGPARHGLRIAPTEALREE